jgi:tetratricopeptide (TPR) repeat protein
MRLRSYAFRQRDWFVFGDIMGLQGLTNELFILWQQHNITTDWLLDVVARQAAPVGKSTIELERYQLDLLQWAQTLSPKRSEPLLYQGLILLRHEQIEEGNEVIEQAVALNGWENQLLALSLFRDVGASFVKYKRPEMAILMYEQAAKHGRTIVATGGQPLTLPRLLGDAYRQLGLLYQQSGEMVKAEANFQAATEVQPENFWNYLSLVFLYQHRRASALEVEKLFQKAIAVAPTVSWPYVKAVEYYRSQQDIARQNRYCQLAPYLVQYSTEWRTVCDPGE